METAERAQNDTIATQKGLWNLSYVGTQAGFKPFWEIEETIGQYFNSGNSEVLSWFLVRQNVLPFLLCGMYVLFVKVIGPAMMKNRRPMTLRKPMILFNLFLVAGYSIALFIFFKNIIHVEKESFCRGTTLREGTVHYKLVRCFWFLYILKYIEFADTIFFVLRKKDHLITILHVVHHTVVPAVGWVMMRTEKSAIQTVPVLINAFVHVVMYTYYGLAAVGPQMKKYLWWKKYLTMLQMVQFVSIILYVLVIAPATGCSIMPSSVWIDIICCVMFLILFYNYYTRTFNRKVKSA